MRTLGVTGNRVGLTSRQRVLLHDEILKADEVRHGACTGADSEAHGIAKVERKRIVVHPPTEDKLVTPVDDEVTWLPGKDYLKRNHDIVDASDLLVALPRGKERLRSGTWATVRYAVKVGKPVLVCYPDGTIEER